jgi:dipeptidyl aminopeptidase/acylaminoacyl peptidase
VVYPDQHEAFQRDYEERGYEFKAVVVEGFGHSFAPVDSNASGKTIDMRSELTDFFSRHLKNQAH